MRFLKFGRLRWKGTRSVANEKPEAFDRTSRRNFCTVRCHCDFEKGDSDGLNLSQDKNEKSFLNSLFFGWGPAPKPPGFFEAYPSCIF